MKNLITILAALTLTGCYKEPKQPKPEKDTNPKIGIYGHLVDSAGYDMGNTKFYASTVSPASFMATHASINMTPFNFSSFYNGDFHVTIRVPEEGDSVYIYPDAPMRIIRAAAFKVNPPIEKWIDIGTLKVNSYYR